MAPPSGSSSRLKINPPAVRESWMAYDALIAKAFGPRDTPSGTSTPTLRSMDLREPHSPKILSPDGQALDPIWDAVRELKSKALAALPSKVKSLEGVELSLPPPPSFKLEEVSEAPLPPVEPRKLKRKASATFKESSDGRTVTAIFDMTGVCKQDMHVSFRGNRMVITWRRFKVVETREDGVLVRDRRERQYSQMIPLPEGTQFSEIRAARSGTFLMLTFPNLRCVKVDSVASSSTAWSSGETDFFTCEAGTMLDFEEFTVEKDVSVDTGMSRRYTKKH